MKRLIITLLCALVYGAIPAQTLVIYDARDLFPKDAWNPPCKAVFTEDYYYSEEWLNLKDRIDTKDETKYNISRDSAGNLLIQKTNSRKYDLAGAGTVTSEDIQVGRIKARRDVATYGFGGFFSVSGGSTVIR